MLLTNLPDVLEDLQYSPESTIRGITNASVSLETLKTKDKNEFIEETCPLYYNLKSLYIFMKGLIDDDEIYSYEAFMRTVDLKTILNYHPLENAEPIFSLCYGCSYYLSYLDDFKSILMDVISELEEQQETNANNTDNTNENNTNNTNANNTDNINANEERENKKILSDIIYLMEYLINYVFKCVKYFFEITETRGNHCGFNEKNKLKNINIKIHNLTFYDAIMLNNFMNKYKTVFNSYKSLSISNHENRLLLNNSYYANLLSRLVFKEYDEYCEIFYDYIKYLYILDSASVVDRDENIYQYEIQCIEFGERVNKKLSKFLHEKIETDINKKRNVEKLPPLEEYIRNIREYPRE